MLIDLNLRKVVCAVAASTFFSLQFSAFGDTVYWKGNSNDAGLGFNSGYGWDKMPSASDDVVIDQEYIASEGNGYLVDGFWWGDTTWNSLTLNYDSISKKLNSNAGGPISITILNDVVKTGGGTAQFAMGAANTVFNLNVGGNIIVGKDKDTNGGVLDLGTSNANTRTTLSSRPKELNRSTNASKRKLPTCKSMPNASTTRTCSSNKRCSCR